MRIRAGVGQLARLMGPLPAGAQPQKTEHGLTSRLDWKCDGAGRAGAGRCPEPIGILRVPVPVPVCMAPRGALVGSSWASERHSAIAECERVEEIRDRKSVV